MKFSLLPACITTAVGQWGWEWDQLNQVQVQLGRLRSGTGLLDCWIAHGGSLEANNLLKFIKPWKKKKKKEKIMFLSFVGIFLIMWYNFMCFFVMGLILK